MGWGWVRGVGGVGGELGGEEGTLYWVRERQTDRETEGSREREGGSE